MRCSNHFGFMESQARAWVFRRLLALHTIWKTHFLEVLQSGRPINETQTTVRIDHHAMLILNALLDLYLDADIAIRGRTDGFNFAHGVDRRLLNGDTPEISPKRLNGIYAGIEAKRVADMRSVLKAAVKEHKRAYEAETKVPGFMKAPMAITHREFGHKRLQPQFEAPLALEVEGWVRELKGDEVEGFGFVAYRVSYEESEDDWAEFLGKVEQGVELGWEGVVGAEGMKKKATLHWVDGKAVGIAEGDLEGVQRYVRGFIIRVEETNICRHFNSNLPSSPTVSNQLCIVATPDAVSSFMFPPTAKSTGDSQPYLIAVSASATTPPPPSKKDSADASSHNTDDAPATPPPGPTAFKIPPRLLYTDLFALGVYYPTLSPPDFAALAAQHPLGLYQGSSTGVRRREWRKVKEGTVDGHDAESE
jgi:hypothetical protein